MEVRLLSNAACSLLERKRERAKSAEKVMKTNDAAQRFGPVLTEQDAKFILEERKNTF